MNKKLKNAELGRLKETEYAQSEKLPLTIVLDNIRSGLNIGSVFRTSDAFRLEQVLLCGICAQPPHRDILKSALGASSTVDWTYHESTLDAVNSLKEEGYRIGSIEQAEDSLDLQNWKPGINEKWAVVMGNEVKGVQQEIVDASDLCIEIPQFGTKHSLNISVCTGMVAWQYMIECGISQFAKNA